MMINDKEKWNEKYTQKEDSQNISTLVQKFITQCEVGTALDIACGTGRNTHFLHEKGFEIDAVDISDVALGKILKSPNIKTVDADFDKYNITPNRYDLIININYLNRRLMPQIKDALKQGGVVIFETFLLAHGEFNHPTMNVEYLLRKNELLHAFIGLDIIYYEEKIETDFKGDRVKIASLVARKS